ncbi:polyubiquitin-like [Sparus aurata]|uniref:polyubiquitin-like n=1 Tax=Sparus aurata TaxID=8175 RepID=UPI0011C1A640|nr:polyubiquitin-like [Sparus aurata]
MDITITMLNGASHHLTVNPQDTVSSLKRLIQSKLGVSVQEQKLVFVNGEKKTLSDDSKPVSWYGLQSGSQVSLLITKPPPFQVSLTNLQGKKSTYDIKPDETVRNFKKRVQSREGVPVSQQRLIYEGTTLAEDEKTFSDYNVEALGTINLTGYLRGG